MAAHIQIVDLDAQEPTDAQVISWRGMMTAPDQLLWEYDESWAKEPTSAQAQIDSFRVWRTNRRGQSHQLWAIIDGRVIGMTGINRLTDPTRSHTADLGFGVAAEFTRQGIGFRLLTAAIAKARAVGLKRLEANCFADNAPSIALLYKGGFAEEGVRVGAICKDGRLRSERLFGLML